jgi:hypothetical protein
MPTKCQTILTKTLQLKNSYTLLFNVTFNEVFIIRINCINVSISKLTQHFIQRGTHHELHTAKLHGCGHANPVNSSWLKIL